MNNVILTLNILINLCALASPICFFMAGIDLANKPVKAIPCFMMSFLIISLLVIYWVKGFEKYSKGRFWRTIIYILKYK